MEINDTSNLGFFIDSIPKQTKNGLEFLCNKTWLKNDGWYLAGGTALALQCGHRRSVDLDFFTQSKNFLPQEVLKNLDVPEWETDIAKEGTIYGKLCQAKVSFIAYPFFLPKERYLMYGEVPILDSRDIAVMKIIATSQRGRKRDFVDLYWYCKNKEQLETVFLRLEKQYLHTEHNYQHILKSLVYFDDAEEDPMPVLNFKVTWSEVKVFFELEIPMIMKKYLDL